MQPTSSASSSTPREGVRTLRSPRHPHHPSAPICTGEVPLPEEEETFLDTDEDGFEPDDYGLDEEE